MIAIPDVNPVITGFGMKFTSLPILKRANTISSSPERKPAANTP